MHPLTLMLLLVPVASQTLNPTKVPTATPTVNNALVVNNPKFLRAGCRTGHPPFSDWVKNECVGMSWALFQQMALRAGISYSIGPLDFSSFTALVNGSYDISISITSITPDRVAKIHFTQPIVAVEYVAVLSAKFSKSVPSITNALFDRAVLYLFALMGLLMVLLALVVVFFERRIPKSELMQFHSWSHRLLFSIELSLANAVTFDGGLFSSQATRSFRAVFVIAMYFFSCLFTSLITSTLTNSVSFQNPDIFKDCRGATIWAGENQDIATFLASSRVNAIAKYQSTLAPIAFGILNGSIPADGFVTSTDEAREFLSRYPDSGFVTSDKFTITGLPEPRAFGLGQNVSLDVLTALNVAMSGLREEGTIAQLLLQYVPPVPVTNVIDLGVSVKAARDMEISAAALYGIFLAVVVCLFLQNWRMKKQLKEAKKSKSRNSVKGKESIELDGDDLGPSPCLTVQFELNGLGDYHPIRCTAFSTKGPPLSAEPPDFSVGQLKYLLGLCRQMNK